MKKIHVFSYHQIAKTNIEKAIKQFIEQSGVTREDISKLLFFHEKEKEGVIFKYKIGGSNTVEFRKELNDLLKSKGGVELEDKVFDDSWNSMCGVDPQKMIKIRKLQDGYDFDIHVEGRTNKLQHECIQQEIQKLPQDEVPKMSYTLSYEVGALDDSLDEHVKNIFSSSNSELVWHTKQPGDALEILGAEYMAEVQLL